MPVYEYLCDACGPFTDMRPMAECELPSACPDCAGLAPRVILTAPHCSSISAERRRAQATNERSANAPKTLSQMGGAHAPGCSCCSGRASRFTARGKNGAKSFPASRPWMISH
jgi:putative FmdB family regulatory protein